jgi:hypothetical protein
MNQKYFKQAELALAAYANLILSMQSWLKQHMQET